MRLLVTGGCGFIGSNFINYIMSRHPDWSVTVFDSLTYAGYLENIEEFNRRSDRFKFIEGDIRDRNYVESAVDDADVVVHFAAESHVSYSFIQADLFADVNVRGTSILCETVVERPVKKLIYISTSEVYGDCLKPPMDENHPLFPRSPYAGSKAAADRLAYSYWVAFKIPLIILRPFNNYGPSQHTEKVIPNFITHALQDKVLEIHDSGEQTRDWLYVVDHAKAIERAIETDIGRLGGEVINLGTGNETSIIDIARMVFKILGKSERLDVNSCQRPGQVKRHNSSTSRAKELLGWQAETKFEDGLVKTIQWYAENKRWWNNLKLRSEKGRHKEIML